jgi:long-chain fatty acid transport protein
MKKNLAVFLTVSMIILSAGISAATNGDNLISIGPISRAMGGVGVAAPQDAISAVFSNPAAMCFGPYCPGSEVNVATTVFLPKARTRITNSAFGLDTGWKTSDSDFYVIPAIGISTPITQNLRFGFAAYGVSGLGVDYKDEFDLDPLQAGNQDVYTNLSILKVAPNLSYLVTPNFSIGASVHFDYGSLDLGEDTESGFGIGAQLGAIYKQGPVSLGLVYVSPQRINHKDVAEFDGHPVLNPAGLGKDDLVLESPQTLAIGVAYESAKKVFLVEANAKWIDWSGAEGYKDFEWNDQWVFSLGAQYKPVPALALRAGVNHGRNPVEENNGWDGFSDPPVDVQGKKVNRFQYEVLRITGFPAVVETHVTAGIGYQITRNISLDLGYTHGFKNSIKETGTFLGAPVTIESSLSEDSIDFGLTWRF